MIVCGQFPKKYALLDSAAAVKITISETSHFGTCSPTKRSEFIDEWSRFANRKTICCIVLASAINLMIAN